MATSSKRISLCTAKLSCSVILQKLFGTVLRFRTKDRHHLSLLLLPQSYPLFSLKYRLDHSLGFCHSVFKGIDGASTKILELLARIRNALENGGSICAYILVPSGAIHLIKVEAGENGFPLGECCRFCLY